MQFLKLFRLILSLAPTIIALVKEVESAIPGRGQGSQKLDLVLNTVKAAAAAEPEISDAIAAKDTQTAITNIISGTVATLNAAGVFKKP